MDFLQTRIEHETIRTAYTHSRNAFWDEDDVYYRELRRQVLLLTEEYDDDVYKNRNMNVNTDAQKHGLVNGRQGKCYYNWPGNKNDCTTPPWILNLWRTGNGTGVFIPQVVQSMRKYRPRRKSEQGRTYKRVEKI